MAVGTLALLFWVVTLQGQVTLASSDDLAGARAFYAAGEYETALTRLESARTDATADEVDQYRALCLLALGRTADSERALRELVDRRPHFRMSEEDVSPRLVAMFRAVRQKMLPGIVKASYARAKTTFEEKRYAQASAALRDLLDLIADPDAAASADALADLKMLTEGFLKLADLEVASAKAAETAAATAARQAAAERPPPTPTIYSDNDPDVTPPVIAARTLPPWRPPNAIMAARSYQGHLRLVVDETGRVEGASLLRSFLPGYESDLLEAARKWQFRPAMRGGVPVKFVRVYTVEVSSAR
jgi:TonB family protein